MDTDARKIDPVALFELRRRAVRMVVEDGMSRLKVARLLGVSRQAVEKWVIAYQKGGQKALYPKKRGVKPGQRSKLSIDQKQWVQEAIEKHDPEYWGLSFPLWTSTAVIQLIDEQFNVRISLSTMGRWLRAWGFVRRRATRRAIERDDKAVECWKEETYPAILAEAAAEGAVVFFGDEMGIRSDQQGPQKAWTPSGKAPIRPVTGRRFGLNVISAISPTGEIRWRIFAGTLTALVFIAFLGRFLQSMRGRKAYLVVDGHPAHKARIVQEWLADREGLIRLIFLPPYAPEINPDEYLNNDLRTDMGRGGPARTPRELESRIRSRFRSHQRRPDRIRNLFCHREVQYALPP